MKVYLASDHAGFELKKILLEHLRSLGHEAVDRGPVMLEPKDDYPDYIEPLAEEVVAHPGAFGIAIGGSGEGEAMSANKVKGARAAEYYGGNLAIVRAAREHNDANILSLGALFINEEHAKEAVAPFLATPFGGEARHVRRIEKLDKEQI